MKTARPNQGFTLVELLVTIAMIALLASLLLPALRAAKDKVRHAVCLNNLHQLGIATQLYWDDHHGRAFSYRVGGDAQGDRYWFGWMSRGAEGERTFDRAQGFLYPYLGQGGVELCPALRYDLPRFKLKAAGAAYGYGYNIHLSGAAGEPPVNLTMLRSPAQLAVLADAAQVNTFQAPASPQHPMLEEFYYISAYEPTTHFRHSGQSAVLYADLHCDSRKPAPDAVDNRLPRERLGTLGAEVVIP